MIYIYSIQMFIFDRWFKFIFYIIHLKCLSNEESLCTEFDILMQKISGSVNNLSKFLNESLIWNFK